MGPESIPWGEVVGACIGRRLHLSELKRVTVVNLWTAETPNVVSLWVDQITPESIRFYGGSFKPPVLIRFKRDDENDLLIDGKGLKVYVFEFIGEP